MRPDATFHGDCDSCYTHPPAGKTNDGQYLCSRCLVVDFLHDQANALHSMRALQIDFDHDEAHVIDLAMSAPCLVCGAAGSHDEGCPVDEPTDGVDHQCGECGRGIPSYQVDGSLCGSCADEIRREENAEEAR